MKQNCDMGSSGMKQNRGMGPSGVKQNRGTGLSGVGRRSNTGRGMMIAGLVLLCVLTLLAVAVPMFSAQSYSDQNAELRNLGTSAAHLFGTDKFGRDIFVRVWYGTRISLLIGVGSAFICGIFGNLVGMAAGYAGGVVDMILMRIADVIDAIPSLLYVILITLTFGANVGSILSGICISGWIGLARIVRGEIQRGKTQGFCAASRLAGAGSFQILFRHLLPNAAGPVIVSLTFLIPRAIFTEAFLSFVGVGISAPAASLGTLIQDARSQMQIYPSQMLYPVLVLCLLILSFNLIGYGLEGYFSEER